MRGKDTLKLQLDILENLLIISETVGDRSKK
jgi:hypothetical protein